MQKYQLGKQPNIKEFKLEISFIDSKYIHRVEITELINGLQEKFKEKIT